jgi:hypothetical protein
VGLARLISTVLVAEERTVVRLAVMGCTSSLLVIYQSYTTESDPC